MEVITNDTTAPILNGEVELHQYSLQGKTFNQRKPCFEFEIIAAKEEFDERYRHFIKSHQIKMTADYLNDDEMKAMFNYKFKDESGNETEAIDFKNIEDYITIRSNFEELTAEVKKLTDAKDYKSIEQLEPRLKVIQSRLDRIEKLRYERPVLYLKFISLLNQTTLQSVRIMRKFLMNKANLSSLFRIMFIEDISVINFEPGCKEDLEELITVGGKVLNDFFLSQGS